MKSKKSSRLDKVEAHNKMQDEAITYLVQQCRNMQAALDKLMDNEEIDEPEYPESESEIGDGREFEAPQPKE